MLQLRYNPWQYCPRTLHHPQQLPQSIQNAEGTYYVLFCYQTSNRCHSRLPGIQPSVCTVLRSNRSNQKRDEQCKMDLVCNRISVPACLLRIIGDQSGRKPGCIWYLQSVADRCSCTDRAVPIMLSPFLSHLPSG